MSLLQGPGTPAVLRRRGPGTVPHPPLLLPKAAARQFHATAGPSAACEAWRTDRHGQAAPGPAHPQASAPSAPTSQLLSQAWAAQGHRHATYSTRIRTRASQGFDAGLGKGTSEVPPDAAAAQFQGPASPPTNPATQLASTSTSPGPTQDTRSQIVVEASFVDAQQQGQQPTTPTNPQGQQLIDKEQLAQEIEQQREKLRQLLDMQARATGADTASGEGGSATADGLLLNGGEVRDQADTSEPVPAGLPWYRRPILTWILCAWAWVVLARQWAPLMGVVWENAPDVWSRVVVVTGVALLVPETPVATSYLMDFMAWEKGEWVTAAVRASFLYGGLLPTIIFTKGLWEAGRFLEPAFGPLVLSVHIALSAWAAAGLHLLMAPAPYAFTGPAVVCGVHAALACQLAIEKWQLRRLQAQQPATATAAATGTAEAADAADDLAQAQAVFTSVPVVSRTTLVVWALGFLLGCIQPMLTVWGVLGGLFGGVIAGLTAPYIVKATGWLLSRLLGGSMLLAAWLLQLPVLAISFVATLVRVVAAQTASFVKAFRRT